MKVAFLTLGCKVNQFDTAAMEEQARQQAHQVVTPDQLADVYVINTCSVTENSDAQARQLIRRAHRVNPRARVVVTGCYAQTHPEEVRKMEGVDLILGTREREHWLEDLPACEKGLAPDLSVNTDFPDAPLQPPLIRQFGERTRAFIKIQDGCDFDCSFCLIPRARGPGRSVAAHRVVEQVRLLVENDTREIVLTGVNLGTYGRDFHPKTSLASLIRKILEETSLPRLRISSVEPKTLTPELREVLRSSGRICRHLHIPLQSGDDLVLQKMNRHYRASYYRRMIEGLEARHPGLGIGTDVLVGFPGESAMAFDRTYRLLADLPISYFHVFPYSPRPETPAAGRKTRVPEVEKSRRSRLLRELALVKGIAFRKKFLGHTLSVLVEKGRDPESGLLKGYSDNYIKVFLEGPEQYKNRILPVKIDHLTDGGLRGNLEGETGRTTGAQSGHRG